MPCIFQPRLLATWTGSSLRAAVAHTEQQWVLLPHVADEPQAERRVLGIDRALAERALPVTDPLQFPAHEPLLRLQGVRPAYVFVVLDRKIVLTPRLRAFDARQPTLVWARVEAPGQAAVLHSLIEGEHCGFVLELLRHGLDGHGAVEICLGRRQAAQYVQRPCLVCKSDLVQWGASRACDADHTWLRSVD
ncbi:MAG: hypothetical protein R3E65_05905 [Steroidobacteraceae bacterium]